MDTGKGEFVELSRSMADEITETYKNAGKAGKEPIFAVGEIVQVKGSVFKIRSFDKFTGIITLRLEKK